MPTLNLLSGITPALYLLIGKKIIDTLVQGLNGGPTGQAAETLVCYVLLGIGVKTLSAITREASWSGEQLFQRRLKGYLDELIITKAGSLDLACFESPAFYDHLERARQEVGYRPYSVISSLLSIGQFSITVLSCLAILATFAIWIVPAVFLVMLPALCFQAYYGHVRWAMLNRRTQDERKMHYLQHLMTNNQEAKEIRVFGLRRYLLDNWRSLFHQFYFEERRVTVRYGSAMMVTSLLQAMAGMGFYGLVLFGAVTGTISVGSVVMLTQAMEQCLGTMESIVQNLGILYESSLFLNNLFDFVRQEPLLKEPLEAVPLPRSIGGRLQLENVTFSYPGTNHEVLRNVSFTIAPGTRVALVGENGAGKTTLVKLLTRLYDPDGGAIYADGIDLRNVYSHDWQKHLAVIFQDFVRFWLTVRENIGFGSVNDMHDKQRFDQAAEAAGASKIISGLPQGWDSVLGRRFDGGYELSLGEWQRVALARALFSTADILILDEPTASLDAKQEYELFQHFEKLTREKTTILISHRLSSARLVDRIFFLEAGRVAEEGSHEELMQLDGRYAAMFRRQASSYLEEAPVFCMGRVQQHGHRRVDRDTSMGNEPLQ